MESEFPKQTFLAFAKKSFTGENGRRFAKSTGMGLYIVKGLCDQLGHCLTITSKENIGTEVAVTFGGNDYYLVDE